MHQETMPAGAEQQLLWQELIGLKLRRHLGVNSSEVIISLIKM